MQDSEYDGVLTRVLWPAASLEVEIRRSASGICRARVLPWDETSDPGPPTCDPMLLDAASQMRAYFEGKLSSFDLPLDLRGTGFQRRVWLALLEIPYGETRTYLGLARSLGQPTATRAVGAANGRNPIPIIVPCHRVVQTGGGLGGYTGGLHIKRALLSLEQNHAGVLATLA